MLSVHTMPEKFENATITGYFEFVFGKNSENPNWNTRKDGILKSVPSPV